MTHDLTPEQARQALDILGDMLAGEDPIRRRLAAAELRMAEVKRHHEQRTAHEAAKAAALAAASAAAPSYEKPSAVSNRNRGYGHELPRR